MKFVLTRLIPTLLVVVAPNGDIVFTESAIPAYLDQFGRPPTLARLIEHRPYSVYRLKR